MHSEEKISLGFLTRLVGVRLRLCIRAIAKEVGGMHEGKEEVCEMFDDK